MISKYKKYILGGILLIILIIFVMHFISKTDGMEQSGILKTSYRVYTKKGWSKWSKNGITSGNKADNISKIDIKTKSGFPEVSLYFDGKWKKANKKNKNAYAIKIVDTAYIFKRYDVCYRTYNKNDKWLNWTCNNNPSGNLKYPISAVEVKVIPKNIAKYEYLKDYSKNINDSYIQ